MAGGTDVFAPAGFEPSLGPSTELRGAGSEQGPGAPSGSARKSAVPSLEVTAGALAAARPEVVCFAVCGWGLQRAASAVQGLLELPEWEWLRKARVLVFDARRLFSEAGPVLVDTLEALLEAVQPEVQVGHASGGLGRRARYFLRHWLLTYAYDSIPSPDGLFAHCCCFNLLFAGIWPRGQDVSKD